MSFCPKSVPPKFLASVVFGFASNITGKSYSSVCCFFILWKLRSFCGTTMVNRACVVKCEGGKMRTSPYVSDMCKAFQKFKRI